MNPEYITIAAACQLLTCDKNTLGRWMDLEGITPVARNRYDQRQRFITRMEVERLAEAHGRILSDLSALPATIAACHRRILQLEQEIRVLKRALESKTTHSPLQSKSDDSPPRNTHSTSHPRLDVQAHTSRPPMPPTWASLDGFCKAHDIAPSTVAKAITSGRLPQPHHGEWQEGRAIIRNALDEEMQAAILAMYRPDFSS